LDLALKETHRGKYTFIHTGPPPTPAPAAPPGAARWLTLHEVALQLQDAAVVQRRGLLRLARRTCLHHPQLHAAATAAAAAAAAAAVVFVVVAEQPHQFLAPPPQPAYQLLAPPRLPLRPAHRTAVYTSAFR